MDDTAYTEFAEIYERHWENFAELICPWFPVVLKRFRLHPHRILDLACGTGLFALHLAGKGYEVVGVDKSQDMLDVARRRSNAQRLGVKWSCQDMRRLSWSEPVDCVTCWFDSLNYLTKRSDIAVTFGHVFDVLTPGGGLVFDVNTLRGLSDRWNTETRIDVDTEDHFVVTDTVWDPETHCNTLMLHGFLRRGDTYRRIHEEHVQRAYPLDELRELLVEAGFEDVHVFGRRNFNQVDEEALRAFFFARRPAG